MASSRVLNGPRVPSSEDNGLDDKLAGSNYGLTECPVISVRLWPEPPPISA